MLALALSLLLTAGPSRGEKELAEAVAHLRAFREEKALESLKVARRLASGSPELLARVHLVTGLVHAQLAQQKHAIESFSSALKLNRELQPSEEDTSPKVLEWFNRARKEHGLPPLGQEQAAAPPVVEQQQAPPPQIVYVPAPAEPPPEPSRVPLYVGIGVAAAGAVAATAGLVFGLRAKQEEQQLEIESDVTRYTELHRSAERNASTANTLFLTSAILGVGAGVVIAVTF